MPIAVGDILQISDFQSFLGNTLLNVFFYEVSAADVDLDYETVKVAFENAIVEPMSNIQSNFCEHVRIVIKNLTNELDIAEFPISVTGFHGGQASQSFVSYSIRLIRSTALTRHGSKRIGGLSEGTLDGNGVLSSELGTVTAFADLLAEPLVMESEVFPEFTAVPVIVGRFHIPAANAGEIDLSKINPVSAAQFIRVTSQATRRAGRGI